LKGRDKLNAYGMANKLPQNGAKTAAPSRLDFEADLRDRDERNTSSMGEKRSVKVEDERFTVS
jgi:hypothetical protein